MTHYKRTWLEPEWDTSWFSRKVIATHEPSPDYTNDEVRSFGECIKWLEGYVNDLLEDNCIDNRRSLYIEFMTLWSYMGYFGCRPKSNKMERYRRCIHDRDPKTVGKSIARLIKRCNERLMEVKS